MIETKWYYSDERNRMEIKFSRKPRVEIREKLRKNGWHWDSKVEVWHNKDTRENRFFAKDLITNGEGDKKIQIVNKTQTSQPSEKFPDKPLLTDLNKVSFDQFQEKGLAKIEITATETGYLCNSSTMLIMCDSCGHLVHIKSQECKDCGCPIQVLYKTIFDEKVKEKQKLNENRIKEYKEGVIKKICTDMPKYKPYTEELKRKSYENGDFERARKNIVYLNDENKKLPSLDEIEIRKLIFSDEEEFFKRIKEIKDLAEFIKANPYFKSKDDVDKACKFYHNKGELENRIKNISYYNSKNITLNNSYLWMTEEEFIEAVKRKMSI